MEAVWKIIGPVVSFQTALLLYYLQTLICLSNETLLIEL